MYISSTTHRHKLAVNAVRNSAAVYTRTAYKVITLAHITGLVP
jgi:hypothetical protein